MLVDPPRQLVVEVASVCNLRCPQCWIGLRWIDRGASNKFMPMDLFHRVCDEVQAYVKHVYLHLWGEPTLHPQLAEMIDRVKRFATVDLATHGLFITEESAQSIAKCDTISVSIDGLDQETYEQYRVGGKLEDAMRGMKLLRKYAERVNWTFVVFKDNEDQIEEGKKLAAELGVNFGDKPPLFWDQSKMDSQMPKAEKHRRYHLVDGEWKLKVNPLLACREFWETTYLLANGDIITCCYDGKAEWVMGNVKERSLLDVWNGEPYTEARKNHSAGQLNPTCAANCQLPA